MPHTIPLDSAWTLHPARLADGAPDLPGEIAATVPGTVHTDLLAAGLIEDPYLDLNEQKDAWIGHSEWVYRTVIREVPEGERVALAFVGLDTVATVLLDGEELGRTANQHRSYRFDVTGRIREGSVLEVRFDDVWAYAEALRDELGDRPNEYPTPGNFARKMAANFGWDWGPQLVTAGIWRDARIEGWSRARLDEVVTQVTVDEDGAGRVHVAARVESDGDAASRALRITVAGVAADATVQDDGMVSVELRVPGVERWWPRGMGAQRRYDLTVALDEDGGSVDSVTRRVGFRSVELDASPDEHGTGFTFVINGIRTVIRGANWIPEDCFPSRVTRQRYRDRLQDAADANLNLIRVWGGGIYESFHFYDLCDEMGLLTWQDFLFACAAYPEEEPLRSEVEAEARENVARLSGHPSLVLFNGANENIEGWNDWGWQQKLEGHTWGLGYYTEMLPGIVSDVAPWTPYWANSPYSGTLDIHPNDPAHGTKHIWDVWNRVDYTGYAAYIPRFAAEYGFQGPPTWSTLTRAIHDDPLTPHSPGMLLHQKAADGMAKIRRGLAPHFPEPVGIEEWHYLAQLNQARAIVFGTGFWRAQRPVCMGTVVWQLNDCWPVTSWAAVDGDGRRKPLWHALRRVNAERLAVIAETEGALALHLVNDGVADWSVRGSLVRSSFRGEVHAEESLALTVPALSSTRIPLSAELVDPIAPTAEILIATLSGVLDGRPVVHTFAEDKSLSLDDVPVRVVVGEWDRGSQPVTLTADSLVRGASLFPDRVRPDAWVSDLDLDLLAGESVTVRVHSPVPLEASALTATLRTLNPLVTRMG